MLPCTTTYSAVQWHIKELAVFFLHNLGAVVVMIVRYMDLQLPMQSVPIITKVVNLNSVHGKVYSIQQYVIKFVCDLQQVSGFLRALGFPPIKPIKLTATI